MHFVEPDLTPDNLNNRLLTTATNLKKFIPNHCFFSKYLYQVKELTNPSFFYCTLHPVCLSESDLSSLSFIPLPLLLQNQENTMDLMTFLTKTQIRRSPMWQTLVGPKTDEKQGEIVVNTNVHAAIVCGECLKSRCIYSRRKFSIGERAELTDLKESRLYACGSSLPSILRIP